MKFLLLILAVVFVIYFPWLDLGKTLSSGDWPYLFTENIQAFKIPADPPFLWLDPYYQLTAKLGVQIFSLSWEVTEKIFWFYPYLIISLISCFTFLRYAAKHLRINKNSLIFVGIGTLIFTTSTYILMVVGGGQMGVAISYSMMPFILKKFFLAVDSDSLPSIKEASLLSFILGVQFMFDPRISILTMLVIFLYLLFTGLVKRKLESPKIIKVFLVFIIAVLINFFWMYQNIDYFNQEYANATGNAGADFLSFATFSNSISLLHPNWPENIFGKIGFMKPEFIFIPILAFASLLFAQKNKKILFFAFLGLFGAFFAKGTNPPFGDVYIFLSSVPGFGIFRDPTKFYVLAVVSYMVLVPYSALSIQEWIISKIKNQKSKIQGKYQIFNLSYVFFIFTILYLLFLIRPTIFGQLTGTFKPHPVPREYVNLKDFLNDQPQSFKTFWVPTIERFGFSSERFPAISSMEFFETSSLSGTLKRFEIPDVKKQLIDEKVKYIIVPYDGLSEIFLTNRKYDDKLYMETINKLKNVGWLLELKNSNFGKIKVFELSY